jgi:hypothetical protein
VGGALALTLPLLHRPAGDPPPVADQPAFQIAPSEHPADGLAGDVEQVGGLLDAEHLQRLGHVCHTNRETTPAQKPSKTTSAIIHAARTATQPGSSKR